MKTFIILCLFVMAVVLLYQLVLRKRESATIAAAATGTLEQKLSVLAQCGVQLSDPFTEEDLLKSWDRKDYEKEGFDLVLVGLGMTEEEEPWRNHSTTLWHFDTEAIDDHGSYKRIAERMVEMTQGSLTVDEIQDHVDLEKKEAWLSFLFRGEQVKIDLNVEDDWVDSTIFGHFVKLLEQSDPTKIYVYYDLGGQDCIIGCLTRNEFERLNTHGLKFVPLT